MLQLAFSLIPNTVGTRSLLLSFPCLLQAGGKVKKMQFNTNVYLVKSIPLPSQAMAGEEFDYYHSLVVLAPWKITPERCSLKHKSFRVIPYPILVRMGATERELNKLPVLMNREQWDVFREGVHTLADARSLAPEMIELWWLDLSDSLLRP